MMSYTHNCLLGFAAFCQTDPSHLFWFHPDGETLFEAALLAVGSTHLLLYKIYMNIYILKWFDSLRPLGNCPSSESRTFDEKFCIRFLSSDTIGNTIWSFWKLKYAVLIHKTWVKAVLIRKTHVDKGWRGTFLPLLFADKNLRTMKFTSFLSPGDIHSNQAPVPKTNDPQTVFAKNHRVL